MLWSVTARGRGEGPIPSRSCPGRPQVRLYNITSLLHRLGRERQSPESLARNEDAAGRAANRDAVGAALRPAPRVRLAGRRRPDAQSLRSRRRPGSGGACPGRRGQGDGSPGARGFPGELPDLPGSGEYRSGAAARAGRACCSGPGRVPRRAGAPAHIILLRTSANHAQPGAATTAPSLGNRDHPGAIARRGLVSASLSR